MVLQTNNTRIEYREATDEELEGCPFSDAIYIEDIYAEPLGQGYGTLALREFQQQIKRNIVAQAYPYLARWGQEWKDMQKRMIAWYEREGFTHIGNGWIFKTSVPKEL